MPHGIRAIGWVTLWLVLVFLAVSLMWFVVAMSDLWGSWFRFKRCFWFLMAQHPVLVELFQQPSWKITTSANLLPPIF
jgi:hypothetical protein